MNNKVNTLLLRRFISYEGLTYLLLFLFPIAGMLVRGWLTNIYNLLFLLGLFYLRKRSQPLRREEYLYLIICAAYVGIYLLSSLVNGWGPIQTHDLGTEIRFVMVIPIYLLVREYPASWRWLLYGSLLGILVIFVQSIHEVHWQGLATAWGAYSKNIIGPFVALMGFWVLYLWQAQSRVYLRVAIGIAFVLAVLALALSGSRGGYAGFLLMLAGWLLLHLRIRWILLVGGVAAALLVIVFYTSSIVNKGVSRAVSGFKAYMQEPDIAHLKHLKGSTGIHLEMWRAAKFFFPDHPIIGVGPGNYEATAKKYADEGKLNPVMSYYGHPHNIFLEALYSKGIIGLVSLLLLLYYPFFFMFRTRHQSHNSASLGMLHIIGITGFSMFDASPILYNNYTSILLLGIAVFFSQHINQVKRIEPAHA
jgi:O-antigen ligase